MSTELDATQPANEDLAFLETPQDILADPDDQADLGVTSPETVDLTDTETPAPLPDMPTPFDQPPVPENVDATTPDDLTEAEADGAELPESTTPEGMEAVTEDNVADAHSMDDADAPTPPGTTLPEGQIDALSNAIADLDARLTPVVENAEQMRNSDGLATAATTFLRKLEILTASIAADHAKLSDKLDTFFARRTDDASALSSDDQTEDTVGPSADENTQIDTSAPTSERALPNDPEVPTLAPVSQTATSLMSMNDAAAPSAAPAELPSEDDVTPIDAPSTTGTEPELEWTADADMDTQAQPDHPTLANSDEGTSLNALLGAGEGLVWMLKKAGIETLEDLANADADALGKKLGIVSDILDLTYWIDQAQERTADLTSNAA
jgi:hypothetical protein